MNVLGSLICNAMGIMLNLMMLLCKLLNVLVLGRFSECAWQVW